MGRGQAAAAAAAVATSFQSMQLQQREQQQVQQALNDRRLQWPGTAAEQSRAAAI